MLTFVMIIFNRELKLYTDILHLFLICSEYTIGATALAFVCDFMRVEDVSVVISFGQQLPTISPTCPWTEATSRQHQHEGSVAGARLWRRQAGCGVCINTGAQGSNTEKVFVTIWC